MYFKGLKSPHKNIFLQIKIIRWKFCTSMLTKLIDQIESKIVFRDFICTDYHIQNNITVTKNVDNTRPKNLIQPIFVRKSYL